jgi:hypothetical protein
MASPTTTRIGAAAVIAAGAGAGAYLFDPDNGNRRRAVARDRIKALFRRGYRESARTAQTAATRARDRAQGVAHEAKRTAEPERPAPNDQELAHRVETAIFRSPEMPKGSVNVNAEADIVYLRGAVGSEAEMEALVSAAKAVDGVRAVENLLHLPDEGPKMKRETKPETERRVKGGAG